MASICAREDLNADEENIFRTVFHPELSYGDFVARLLPMSDLKENAGIQYKIIAGILTKALARAISNPDQSVVLIIDEINRGNTAEIFGDIFQLLDRNDRGESDYRIHLTDLAQRALKSELPSDSATSSGSGSVGFPSNFYIIGTMNTNDESVYFMDSAFKRRWDFHFVSESFDGVDEFQKLATIELAGLEKKITWEALATGINRKLILSSPSVRNADDKLIGPWFIKAKNASTPSAERLRRQALSTLKYIIDNKLSFPVYSPDQSKLSKPSMLDVQNSRYDQLSAQSKILSEVADQFFLEDQSKADMIIKAIRSNGDTLSNYQGQSNESKVNSTSAFNLHFVQLLNLLCESDARDFSQNIKVIFGYIECEDTPQPEAHHMIKNICSYYDWYQPTDTAGRKNPRIMSIGIATNLLESVCKIALGKIKAQAETSNNFESGKIPLSSIRGKLLLYLWDNVFPLDKSELIKYADPSRKKNGNRMSFSEFQACAEAFILNVAKESSQSRQAKGRGA